MKKLIFLLVYTFLTGRLSAQDVDTTLLKGQSQGFTILSQIPDPVEASAFLAILGTSAPPDRYRLAFNFAEKYPQSWLLAETYDLLARSDIDLGKYAEAIAAARFSLRLLPENPILLGLLANVESQQKQSEAAIRDASSALDYYRQIEHPASMTEKEWKAALPQLRASAYFARGRAEFSEAIPSQSPSLLAKALADLDLAAAWNPADSEIFYLRAMVNAKTGNNQMSAADFAYVYKSESNLAANAGKFLQVLARNAGAHSVDDYVAELPSPNIDKKLIAKSDDDLQSPALIHGYAGPEACKQCHEREYGAWRKTGMARMLQPYARQNLLVDFESPPNPIRDVPDTLIRVGMDRRPFFELHVASGWQRFYVDFTIGSKWQQAYVTKLRDGRLQVLPIQYNALRHEWIDYWKIIDPPESLRADVAKFPELSTATNYQQNCAICHTSQLKADTSVSESLTHATFLQPGIDCEMCHGPSAWHVEEMKKGKPPQTDPTQPPVDFRKISNREGVAVCAQCHRQSAVREFGEHGEMNYSTETAFVPKTWVRPYDAFSRKAFYKDGRFRETTFIVEAFTRSACYLRGTAQCSSCHSPHLGDFDSNKTALKFAQKPDEMCLGCHNAYRTRIAQHTHHKTGAEASQCVTCHMPRIVNALLFQARSHQIEIPAADLTERFGRQESPNVCLMCHNEKPVVWAEEQLSAWKR